MSETTEHTAPQVGGPPEPAPEPEATAPVENGAAAEQQAEERKPSYAERRIAVLTARMTAQQREIEELRQAREAMTQRQEPQAFPQTPEELERLIDQRAEAKAAQKAAQDRAQAFHEAGRSQYADWHDRCSSLIQMGADAGFSQLLVEMPEGARVAAALADDPEELERIAGLRTERARAIALGKFAASLPAQTPAAAPRRRTSNAPAPIRPVNGTANAAFDPYRSDDPEALVDYFRAQDAARRKAGQR